MTNNIFKNNYFAVLVSECRPRCRSNNSPGAGLEFAKPGPELQFQGPQKVARSDLDQTLDSLGRQRRKIMCLAWLGILGNNDLKSIAFRTGQGLMVIYY